MAFSKIILNGTTLIDLTSDTVATDNLIAPNTAHNNAGIGIVGTATGGGNDFVVTVSEVNGVWTPDKTFAEIQTAYSAGKNICVVSGSGASPASGTYYGSDQVLNYTVDYYDYNTYKYITQWYVYDANGVQDDGSVDYINTPTETISITANGTHDVTNYASAVVNVSGGSSMNAQSAQSTTRATTTSYTECISLTCSKAGTYDVYWSTFRSSTSGTWGSQLYLNSTAYGTAQTGSWSNHIQNIHLTNVQISANAEVSVYVRSRGSNYYGYVGTLTIIQTA